MQFPGATHLLIFCKSKRAAERTLENLIPFIEKKLFLKVNREKTEVAYVCKVKFLGYAFYINDNRDADLRVHPKNDEGKDTPNNIKKQRNGIRAEKVKTQAVHNWMG